jgi:hypothetical protein
MNLSSPGTVPETPDRVGPRARCRRPSLDEPRGSTRAGTVARPARSRRHKPSRRQASALAVTGATGVDWPDCGRSNPSAKAPTAPTPVPVVPMPINSAAAALTQTWSTSNASDHPTRMPAPQPPAVRGPRPACSTLDDVRHAQSLAPRRESARDAGGPPFRRPRVRSVVDGPCDSVAMRDLTNVVVRDHLVQG